MKPALLHPTVSSSRTIPPARRPAYAVWPEPILHTAAAPLNYTTELPAAWPPPAPDRDFLRANCWSIEIPGLPVVPGGSSRQPQRFLSWHFDRHTKDHQEAWLDRNQANGYTHGFLSAADSMAPLESPNPALVPPGGGLSLEGFVQVCGQVAARIPYVVVFIGSKYYQPHNMTPQQWADHADPIMDACMDANVVTEFILGWEWNLWNTPGPDTIAAFKHCGQRAHARGRVHGIHFSPHYTSWFADGDPRGRYGFYEDLGPDVDYLEFQAIAVRTTDPNLPGGVNGLDWAVRETQDRLVDTLAQFGTQNLGHKMRFFEDVASQQFDNTEPTETDADQRGYLACCTIDNVKHTDAKIWGYGNGGRRPNGDPL